MGKPIPKTVPVPVTKIILAFLAISVILSSLINISYLAFVGILFSIVSIPFLIEKFFKLSDSRLIITSLVLLCVGALFMFGSYDVNPFGALVGALFIISLYVMPTVLAYTRSHRSFAAIAVLSLLFGWTIIGWVIALIWSLTGNINTQK